MLNPEEAISKFKLIVPDRHPKKFIVYGNLYLIFAPSLDPDEGLWDPYFSVDMNTGEIRDYSIYQDGKAKEIVLMFQNAPTIQT